MKLDKGLCSARQSCCMAGTMKCFALERTFFSIAIVLLFLPCNMAAVQYLYSRLLRTEELTNRNNDLILIQSVQVIIEVSFVNFVYLFTIKFSLNKVEVEVELKKRWLVGWLRNSCIV